MSFYTTRPSEYLHTHTGKKNEYGCADFGAALQQIDDNIGGGKVGWLSEVNAMETEYCKIMFVHICGSALPPLVETMKGRKTETQQNAR